MDIKYWGQVYNLTWHNKVAGQPQASATLTYIKAVEMLKMMLTMWWKTDTKNEQEIIGILKAMI